MGSLKAIFFYDVVTPDDSLHSLEYSDGIQSAANGYLYASSMDPSTDTTTSPQNNINNAPSPSNNSNDNDKDKKPRRVRGRKPRDGPSPYEALSLEQLKKPNSAGTVEILTNFKHPELVYGNTK